MATLTHCVCGLVAAQVFSRGGLNVLVCKCGVGRLNGTVDTDELEAAYRSGKYHRVSDRHTDCVPYADRYTSDLYVATVRWKRYGEILGGARLGRIRNTVDVGAANAAFVDYLSSLGLNAWGVEPSPDFARANVVTGTLTDLFTDGRLGKLDGAIYSAIGLGRADLITYHDVLEHLVDPQAELKVAASLLAPGGVLIIDVPDVWNGTGEKHFKAEHLWYFTGGSIIALMASAGVPVLATDCPLPGKQVFYGMRP